MEQEGNAANVGEDGQINPVLEVTRLFNAHLGGEARKFLQNEDMEKIDTVNKLHELLRGTFPTNTIGKTCS